LIRPNATAVLWPVRTWLRSPIGVLVVLAAVTGIVLRIWTYRSLMGTPNADEAVVGLMARHAEHGHLTTFFWGQDYGGPQEAWLTVPLFWVFGPSWFCLPLILVLLTAASAVAVWRVGLRTIGDPGATVAAALLWVWPPFAVFELLHQQGFYASDVLYCALLLLLALRLVERPDRVRVVTFSLVLGLALWESVQLVTVAVGVVAWILWKAPRALRQIGPAAAAFVLGASPWLVWIATHGSSSLTQGRGGMPLRSLRLLASPYLPMITGFRAPFSGQLLIPTLLVTYLVFVVAVIAFAVSGWRSRRRTVSLVYLVAVCFPLLYVLAPHTADVTGNPRYLMVIVPVLVLLIAQLARTTTAAVAVVAVGVAISFVTLKRMNDWFGGPLHPTTQVRAFGGPGRYTVQLVPRNLDPLIQTLRTLRVKYVYTDYWLAYRLDFDSNEQVVAVENRLTGIAFDRGKGVPTHLGSRYAPYAREVARANHSFVFYRKLVASASVARALTRHGYGRHMVAGFVIFTPPT
jgi:hypothetical protein